MVGDRLMGLQVSGLGRHWQVHGEGLLGLQGGVCLAVGG